MMTPARRFTALASALFALSAGVSAATLPDITLDFEKAGNAATDPTALKPVEWTSEPGLKLSGAWAYGWKMLTADDKQASPGEFNPDTGECEFGPGKCNEGGFIVNRNRGQTNGSTISLLLDSSDPLTKGRFFQSITFDWFTNFSKKPVVRVYTDKRGDSRETDNFSGTNGEKFWTTGINFDVTSLLLANITEIEFDVGSSTIGLDNLKITLTAATDPSKVPEPASYALVGLALLAAGAARRRNA